MTSTTVTRISLYTTLLCTSLLSKADGFFDLNLYPYLSDVDSDSALTLNIAQKFSTRLSYFSLTNLYGEDRSGYLPGSLSYYSEQNLRWQITEGSPFDLTAQFNFRSGSKNNRHRLGIRWRLNDSESMSNFFKSIHLSYSINLHAVQFDHEDPDVWQIEHAFMMKFPSISKRLYLSGFIDHTFNQDLPEHMPKSPIVAEAQLGYNFADNWYAVAEYRLNQYRRQDVNNVGIGVQYKFNW